MFDTEDNKFDDLIQEAIDKLASDSIAEGAEAMVEIAQLFAKAGMTAKAFRDLRTYIVLQAEQKTDKQFILEKLKIAERELHERRQGERKQIIIN